MLPPMHTPNAILAAALAAAALPGCSARFHRAPAPPPSSPDVQEIRAVRVADAPAVDGNETDGAWAQAPSTTVPLDGPSGPRECSVRAVVSGGTLYLLVRWADGTEDRRHKPWLRLPDGTWGEGPEREDVLAVAFPISGEFTADMLSPVECVWDVWQWKAARTDGSGHAMDKTHRNTFADPGGKRHAALLPDGRTLHIARPEDEGTSATETLPQPASGDGGPKSRARKPEGSAASVAARGAWRKGAWTVELARALRADAPDDRDFWGLRDIPFALAILDRAEDEDHAASGVLRLVFPVPSE